MSGASERANGRASGPVLQSGFLFILDHSVPTETNSKNYVILRPRVMYFFQPKQKKRRFWLVDAPKSSRASKAPTNRSIIFAILQMTESKMSVAESTSTVVRSQVVRFYDQAGLPTIHVNTMQRRAAALYNQYRRLGWLQHSYSSSVVFEKERGEFLGNLDAIFDVQPVTGLNDEQQSQFILLKVE